MDEACVDGENGIVTAPAYMCDAQPHEVYESVGAMVEAVLELVSERSSP